MLSDALIAAAVVSISALITQASITQAFQTNNMLIETFRKTDLAFEQEIAEINSCEMACTEEPEADMS